MRKGICLLTACGLFFMAASSVAADHGSTPAAAFNKNGFDPRMLNASVPEATRLKLFSHIIDLANEGQVRAQDLAGTLYWKGSDVSGSPVDQDLKQARTLLENAAIHGDALAMAKLGELELQSGRTLQAMIWAQMYARYVAPMAHQRSVHRYKAAYASDLVQRIIKAGGKIDAAVKKDVSALVNRYDEQIRSDFHAYRQERRHGNPRLISPPIGNVPMHKVDLNGVAEYMVAFDPAGMPGKVWLLASYPTPEMDKVLRSHLTQVRANPVASGSGMRYLRIPVVHDAERFRALRPVH